MMGFRFVGLTTVESRLMGPYHAHDVPHHATTGSDYLLEVASRGVCRSYVQLAAYRVVITGGSLDTGMA